MAKEGMAAALPNANVRSMGQALQRSGYQVFLRDGSLYAFKGLAGKLGPIGVHAAMLLVMAGALLPLWHTRLSSEGLAWPSMILHAPHSAWVAL